MMKYSASTKFPQFFKMLHCSIAQDYCSSKNTMLTFQYPILFWWMLTCMCNGEYIYSSRAWIIEKVRAYIQNTLAHCGQKVPLRNFSFMYFQCKIYFFSWNFVRQYSNLQNDILDLHVALAKKILHMFEKSMKNP